MRFEVHTVKKSPGRKGAMTTGSGAVKTLCGTVPVKGRFDIGQRGSAAPLRGMHMGNPVNAVMLGFSSVVRRHG
jgi:hypothetical protein